MKNPKVICLMPVKNEVDILPITLEIISRYCDIIIIADQISTDGSRDIYRKFPKIRVIDNKREGHSNQVRWDLLKAAREYDGNNLLICLDADEYIPTDIFNNFINKHDFKIGESFEFPWIQLWKSIRYFNNTTVWHKNYQRIAWIDDRKTKYEDVIIINDHVSRVPQGFSENSTRVDDIPIIHLQWLSWEKTQFKQVLYRCTELIKKPKDFISINSKYSHSLDFENRKLSKTPKKWIEDSISLNSIEKLKPSWHRQEIYNLFNKYGILFFEPLQIWHIPELEKEFIKIVGRKPVSIQESFIFRMARDLKRKLTKIIKYR